VEETLLLPAPVEEELDEVLEETDDLRPLLLTVDPPGMLLAFVRTDGGPAVKMGADGADWGTQAIMVW
jgi:hypothetical protein